MPVACMVRLGWYVLHTFFKKKKNKPFDWLRWGDFQLSSVWKSKRKKEFKEGLKDHRHIMYILMIYNFSGFSSSALATVPFQNELQIQILC